MINPYIFVFFPILIAFITYLLKSSFSNLLVYFLQVALLLLSIVNFYDVRVNGDTLNTIGGYPINVSVVLENSLVSSVFIMLTVVLFTSMLIFTYYSNYANKLFIFLFLILQGLINGIFLSIDLFNIYVLIEVSTIIVSILIMFKKDSRSLYDGIVYLLTNLVSMSLFLLGAGYIYKIFGTLNLLYIKDQLVNIESTKALILPYSLLITSVGLKSAVMPLFSWLPRAHGTPSAPSIISAILSGLYVKTGIYLFMRLQDTFYPVIDTLNLFILMGFLTALIGFILALCQTDIKLVLAYSTVSQIGLVIFGLSLNNIYSYWGSIYHIVNHSIFKSVLFLTAGLIIDEYDTRNIEHINGVFKRLPFLSFVSILAIMGITGAPLFNGSVSKYLIQSGFSGYNILDYAILLLNFGTILIFVKYSSMFFGESENLVNPPIHIPLNQKFILIVLSTTCFLGGLLGNVFIKILFDIEIYSSIVNYLQKSFVYFKSLVGAFIFYK